MATGEQIRQAREAKGISQSALALAIGISQPAVKKIESGETQRTRYMAEIERYLELDASRVDAQRTVPVRLPQRASARDDLPVYSAAEGGPGVMVVSNDPIEFVERPWYLGEVRDGFGVLIVGDSMEPAFEPGDIAVVNPRLPPMRNKNTILATGEHGGLSGGDFRATVKRLLRWDADHWYVRQFNEPRDFALDRREWPLALRIVGKHEA